MHTEFLGFILSISFFLTLVVHNSDFILQKHENIFEFSIISLNLDDADSLKLLLIMFNMCLIA